MPHKDPEVRKAWFRAYHLANRDRILKRAAAYRKANPELIAATKKLCYEREKKDPAFLERRKIYQLKRRALNRDHVKAIENVIRNLTYVGCLAYIRGGWALCGSGGDAFEPLSNIPWEVRTRRFSSSSFSREAPLTILGGVFP